MDRSGRLGEKGCEAVASDQGSLRRRVLVPAAERAGLTARTSGNSRTESADAAAEQHEPGSTSSFASRRCHPQTGPA
jgi:hypothetical protein